MNLEKEARDIATIMKFRGLYAWHVTDFVENMNLPITTSEKEKLVELVKKKLNY